MHHYAGVANQEWLPATVMRRWLTNCQWTATGIWDGLPAGDDRPSTKMGLRHKVTRCMTAPRRQVLKVQHLAQHTGLAHLWKCAAQQWSCRDIVPHHIGEFEGCAGSDGLWRTVFGVTGACCTSWRGRKSSHTR